MARNGEMSACRWHRLGAVVVLLLAIGCAGASVRSEPQAAPASEKARTIDLRRATAQRVSETIGVYGDPDLASYVSQLGLAVAQEGGPEVPWEFRIVDSPVVNGFALPGGFIYLTRGLLAHLNSEAAPVGVLSHEIAHLAAGHVRHQLSASGSAGCDGEAVPLLDPEARLFGGGADRGLELLFLRFSEAEEREAREVAARSSRAAGYEPREIEDFLETLEGCGRPQPGEIPSWLDTHPSSRDPAEPAAESAAPSVPLRIGEDEYKRRIENLVYGKDPREGFLEGSRFQHPELQFQIDLPPGWEIRNRRRSITAASPDQSAALELTVSCLHPGTGALGHALAFFQKNQLGQGTGEAVRIGPFPAYRAPVRLKGSLRDLRGEAGVILDGGYAIEVLGLAPSTEYRRYRSTFLNVIRSVARWRESPGREARPMRLSLFRVPGRMSLKEALSRAGVSPEMSREIASLNHCGLEQWVDAGELLKVVACPSEGGGENEP